MTRRCSRGHELTESNSRPRGNGRVCRTCANIRNRNYRARQKQPPALADAVAHIEPTPGEDWRPVQGFEGVYEVSSRGRVRSLPRTIQSSDGKTYRYPSLVLSPGLSEGYLVATLSNGGDRRGVPVHRIVALAFLGPRPDGMEIRHLDGNPINNAAANLAYGTHQENMDDRKRHGTAPKTLRRFTRQQVQEIHRRHGEGASIGAIARWLGASQRSISLVVRGISWPDEHPSRVGGFRS